MIHEIRGIKAEMPLRSLNQVKDPENKIKVWKTLAHKVSEKWIGPSAIEEIIQQREKSW